MFTFGVVFLAWCALSIPIGVLLGHILHAKDLQHRQPVPIAVQDPRARRAA
jgi:hypothetical protein